MDSPLESDILLLYSSVPYSESDASLPYSIKKQNNQQVDKGIIKEQASSSAPKIRALIICWRLHVISFPQGNKHCIWFLAEVVVVP